MKSPEQLKELKLKRRVIAKKLTNAKTNEELETLLLEMRELNETADKMGIELMKPRTS